MNEAPDVSVVIPTRDRWPFLRQTVGSALAQRGVSIEVVVVDDGSSDDTADGLARLRDPRVRVCGNDVSSGVAAARNAGIRAARAPWVAFLDDDDLWSPEKLTRQLVVATEAGAAFAYCAAAFVNDHLEVIEELPAPSADGLLRRLLPANVIPAGASNVVARTEVVRKLGGFDESLFQVEDWDLWIRLAEAARAAACHEPLVAYRVHGANMAVRREAEVLEEIERFAAKHADLAASEGVEIDRVRYTRWIAWIRRREGRRFSAAAMYLSGAVRYRSPGNLVRAAGALMGERAMRLSRPRGAASQSSADPTPVADLPWLEPYR